MNNKQKHLVILLTSLLLLATGCRSNPYPDEGLLVQAKPNKVQPTFALDLKELVEFHEGSPNEFMVVGYVPSKNPVITFEGLPKGAVYDPITSKVTWTPDYNAANEANDTGVIRKIYPVIVVLKDANDPLTVVKRTITLIVNDVPRDFKLDGYKEYASLREGSTFLQTLNVISEDFPNGPFVLQAEDLPEGAKVTTGMQVPTVFQVTYTPSYSEIDNGTRTISVKYNIYDPRGRKITAQSNWTIESSNFAFYTPEESSNLTEGLQYTQDFNISSADFPNGPFTIRGENLPDGAKIVQNPRDPREFKVNFKPDYGYVNATGKKLIKWNVYVAQPNGREIKKVINWSIDSNPQNPLIYIPANINQGPPIVNFMVNVVNPNGDTYPELTVTKPSLGKIKVEEVNSGTIGSKPFKNFNISWTEIPLSEQGKRSSLKIKACNGSSNLCTSETVSVFLNGGKP